MEKSANMQKDRPHQNELSPSAPVAPLWIGEPGPSVFCTMPMNGDATFECSDLVAVNYNPNPTIIHSPTLTPYGAGLSSEQIKEALVKYVEKSYFLNLSCAKEIEILNVEYSFVSIYYLNAYNQKRKLKEKYERFKSGRIDDDTLGRMPDMWQMSPLYEPSFFQKYKEKQKVPHSESLRTCHFCFGSGKTTDTRYDSKNKKHVSSQVTCYTCGGNGKLKFYIQLTIVWETSSYEFVSSDFKIPPKKLKNCEPHTVFKESNRTVLPINYKPDSKISQNSLFLINKHAESFHENQIPIRQGHRVDIIDVAACHYQHNNRLKTFYVFGKEMNVCAPEFPKKICSLM